MNVPYSGGELITTPSAFVERELVLNCATSTNGSIRVGIQSGDGRPILGYALNGLTETIGDEVERTVTWTTRPGLSTTAGTPGTTVQVS